jgi:hypothetical protein
MKKKKRLLGSQITLANSEPLTSTLKSLTHWQDSGPCFTAPESDNGDVEGKRCGV